MYIHKEIWLDVIELTATAAVTFLAAVTLRDRVIARNGRHGSLNLAFGADDVREAHLGDKTHRSGDRVAHRYENYRLTLLLVNAFVGCRSRSIGRCVRGYL
jgi:hypothetical protein